MLLICSVRDCELFWEGRGLLATYASLGPAGRRNAELFAAHWCPDKKKRRNLLACNRRRQKKDCARGDHNFSYGLDDERRMSCAACGAKSEPVPEWNWSDPA